MALKLQKLVFEVTHTMTHYSIVYSIFYYFTHVLCSIWSIEHHVSVQYLLPNTCIETIIIVTSLIITFHYYSLPWRVNNHSDLWKDKRLGTLVRDPADYQQNNEEGYCRLITDTRRSRQFPPIFPSNSLHKLLQGRWTFRINILYSDWGIKC